MRQRHHSMLRVTIALLTLVLTSIEARAQGAAEDAAEAAEDAAVDAITQLNKDAINAYQGKNYEDARRILKRALETASSAGLDNHPIAARTHLHLGIVMIVGFSQRDLGIEQFKKALEIQPDIKLTRVLVTPDLSDAFAEAKAEGKAEGKAGGAAPPGTPPPAPSETRDTNETTPAAPPATPVGPAILVVPVAPAAPGPPAASPPPVEGRGRGLTQDAVTEARQPGRRYFVGLMVGAGFGWATGEGDTNADVAFRPAGLAAAGVGQFGPEVGYWMTSSLMLSGQLRYEYITGTTDIYATSPMHTYHTANYALAMFAKATWKYGAGSFHPFFSLAAGGGRIRHVVNFRRQNLVTCGPNRNETCVDTIGAGPVLLGPGAGFLYDVSERAALVIQINSVLGFPTFTVNLDANVGVAFGF